MKRASLLLVLLAVNAHAGTARLALVVGTNEGGASRPPLWFAEQDAEHMASTLIELADFPPISVRVLKRAGVASLSQALSNLRDEARAAIGKGDVPLVVFYYSGHADFKGLNLGSETFSYSDIFSALTGISAGVRVVLIDACNSGALTQVKGATPARLDFQIPSEATAEGTAVITSASASELAQESAALQGSFFTHHFVLGLRGAADADADAQVTLAEAYRYAYHRTLSATARAGVMPQHPTYSMHIAGKGELILVDLRHATATLSFSAGPGRSYLLTRANDVVAELFTSEKPLRIALPAGRYRVERLRPSPRIAGEVDLSSGSAAVVDDRQLSPIPVLASREKGLSPRRSAHVFGQFLVASPILRNFGAGYGGGLGSRFDFGAFSLIGALTYAQKDVDDGAFEYRYRAGLATLTPALRVELGTAELLVGAELGLAFAHQSSGSGSAEAWVLQLGPTLGVIVPLRDRLSLRVATSGLLYYVIVNDQPALRASVELKTAVEWGF